MKNTAFFFVMIFGFLTACDSSASNTNSNVFRGDSAPSNMSGGKTENQSTQPAMRQASLEKAADSSTQPNVSERKIIRDADLEIEANAPDETQRKITSIAESKGGFVIESTQSGSDVDVSARDVVTMNVRVPAEKFSEALAEIRGIANRVIVETVRGQDVTEEFVDIEARLKAKLALEEQFIEIMKRTSSVSDALSVQKELANVRGEIEQIEGRKRFLENQTALSTIKLRIQTPNAFSASSSGFFYQFGQAFSDGFNFALKSFLFLIRLFIGLLPFLLFVVLPLFIVIRYFLKRTDRQKLVKEIVKEEISKR